MAIDGPAGAYDIVLDYAGEARLSVDRGGDAGGARAATEPRPPTAPASRPARVALGAGRHEIELRLATRAGVASFSLYVLPAGARAAAGRR